MECTNTQNLIHIASIAPKLSERLRNVIEKLATKFFEELNGIDPNDFDDEQKENHVGEFLSSWNLSIHRQSKEDIQFLVQCVPTALQHKGNGIRHLCDGYLPIDWVGEGGPYSENGDRLPFLPILAVEGSKHNIGGKGKRGGLLSNDDGHHLLQSLSCYYDKRNDSLYLDVLKELREKGLLLKEDIQKYDLCHPNEGNKARFNYLVNWDPSVLKKKDENGQNLLHICAIDGRPGVRMPKNLRPMIIREDDFEIALMATLRHYPQELGLLLVEDSNLKKTAVAFATEQRGEEKCWEIISRCIDRQSDTTKLSLIEKDEENNIYPFMLAAAVNELNMTYYLIRQDPHVLTCGHNNELLYEKKLLRQSQKRKR